MEIFATRAWVGESWQRDVRVSVAVDGTIAAIAAGAQTAPGDVRIDTLLPALANVHSHGFQRAMAGMTEYRASGQDSFWTWRTLMYRFLEHLGPEHIEAIAAQVYLEMLEAGYASVGEFHYVHHQPGGQRYDNRTELSGRILAAAARTGIGLTHLPVLYTYGGAGRQALSVAQARFGHSVDEFADLMVALRAQLADAPADTVLGVAPHSLRATAPDELAALVSAYPGGPVHIHIAEQPKEVDDVTAWLGARPVEWLLAHQDVDARWCAIHATHMTAQETAALARSGAVAGLCPITEANLGDGPFNGAAFLKDGGAFAVGSDSNIRISLTEELRSLEYSQRLRDLSRNVLVPCGGSVGQTLYLGAAAGGAQALGRNAGRITVGALADLMAISSDHPYLCGLTDDQLLDGFCFAADDRVVSDVWSAGRHVVSGGRHIHRDRITSGFRQAMADLRTRLAS